MSNIFSHVAATGTSHFINTALITMINRFLLPSHETITDLKSLGKGQHCGAA
jgi:hypothetical protein